tara:strand:+ start:1514 stop:2506 length:993 start_codon:yes stop_codon:yes gene_type:complete
MSLLIVYNACGISGRENSSFYIRNIRTILNQDLEDKRVVFSGCQVYRKTFEEVYREFGDSISYYLTNEKLAVNQSFNHAVLKAVQEFGKFDGYMYVASDVRFTDDKGSLGRLHNRILQPDIGIVSPEIDNDNGYFWWFDFEEGRDLFDVFGNDKDFVVPLGATANLHTAIFSNEIFEAYGNILPDIFVSYCTESTFSFLAAALRQRFVITNDVKYSHGVGQAEHQGLDGQTLAYGAAWDRVFPGSKTVKEIVENPEAKACGFGHEEWVPRFIHKMDVPDDKTFLIHDPTQFDKNSFSTDDRLKKFLASNLYLSPDVLDYNRINNRFIRGV